MSKPIEVISPEKREKLRNMQGYVILATPPSRNAYQGYIEQSFSMDFSESHVNFFWSSDDMTKKHAIDGKKEADYHVDKLLKSHPDWKIEVWSVHDDDLPIELNWERWIDAQAFNPNTLSGVTNKFRARNFEFSIKGDEAYG